MISLSRQFLMFGVCLAIGCLMSGSRALAGGGPSGYIVVYNANNPASVTVANRYQQVRGIPEQNMMPSTFPTTVPQFWTFIDTIQTTLKNRGIYNQFQGVVLISDTTVADGLGISSGVVFSLSYCIYCSPSYYNAVNPALSAFPTNLPANQAYREAPFIPTALTPQTPVNQLTYWPVSYLGNMDAQGNSPKEVLAYIDRAKSHDGTKANGTIYWPLNSDIRSGVRSGEIQILGPIWKQMGIKYSVLSNTQWVSGMQDIQGGVVGIMNPKPMAGGNVYLPGAWVDHLTSYGASMGSYSDDDSGGGQMPISQWIRAGADGSSGTMVEPGALGWEFTAPQIHNFFRLGTSLAEAYWQSIQSPDKNVVLGDPLLQPYADIPVVTVSAPANGSQINGTVAINASALASGTKTLEANLDLFIDGRRIAIGQGGETVNASRNANGFSLDTTTLNDGWHEIRVAAYNADSIRTQGESWVAVTVNNHAQSVALSGPSTVDPASSATFTATPTGLSGVSNIKLQMNGRTLATLAASGGSSLIAGNQFPLSGTSALYAVANLTNGQQIWSQPVSISSVWSAQPAVTSPVLGSGYANVKYFANTKAVGFNWDTATPDASGVYMGDNINTSSSKKTLNMTASSLGAFAPGKTFGSYTNNPGYEVNMLFYAPLDDWYEFASDSTGMGIVQFTVDGNIVGSPISTTSPQHLAPGWHRIRYRVTFSASNWTWHLYERGGYSQNFRSPYYTRIVSEGDGSSLPAPQVVSITPSSSPVTGTTVTLTAVGNDPAKSPVTDDSDLTYTWFLLGNPSVLASFSANGTNAAKATTVTFPQAGTYVIGVLAKHISGGTTSSAGTSSITVTVQQTTTKAAIVVSGGGTVNGTSTAWIKGFPYQMHAELLDQFGYCMPNQGSFTWTWTTNNAGAQITGLDPQKQSISFVPQTTTTTANVTAKTTVASTQYSITTSNTQVITDAGPTVTAISVTGSSLASPVTLRMTASHSQDPVATYLTYQWQVVSTPPGQTLTLQYADCTTAFAMVSGTGVYTVMAIAQDVGGKSASMTASFQVAGDGTVVTGGTPQVTSQPSDKTVLVGDNAAYFCMASDTSVTYQWQVSSDGGTTWLDIAGANSQTYGFGPVAALDNGKKYRAKVSNFFGTAYSRAALLTVTNPTGGVVQLVGYVAYATESDGQFAITFKRYGSTTGALTVQYYLLCYSGTFRGNVTPPAGTTLTTYEGIPAYAGTLTWASGDGADKQWVLGLAKDGVAEGQTMLEMYLDSITQGSGSIGHNSNYQVIYIHDSDGPGEITFDSNVATIREDQGSVVLNLKRLYSAQGSFSVNYATVPPGTTYTATPGVNYTASSGTVTWADQDAADKQITIPVLDDGSNNGNKTFAVTISLPSGVTGGYDGSSPGQVPTAVVTITDAPAHMWQSKWWPGITDAVVIGDNADPDKDGISNLMERALGTDPTKSSSQPQTVMGTDRLQLQFTRARDAIDVVYHVDACSDLVNWVEIWNSTAVPYGGGNSDTEQITVPDTVPLGGPPNMRFMRLRVTK